MIGILVAIKSILEIKSVAGALGALDAGLNVAALLKILMSKVKRNSIDYQIICAIDEALKEACKELEWEYNALAVSQELDPSMLLNSTAMTKAELGRLFAVLVGAEIEDNALDVIIDCFDKSVAGKEELHRYLDMKWKRYIEEETIPFTDFSVYYELVEKRFTSKKRGNQKKLVGEYSDEKAYIDAYISVNNKEVPVLSFLEEWFCEDTSETMLIYGEPGHGKSILCDKAAVEYIRGNFLKDKAKNVIAISLNIGENHRIINDKGVNIEAALSWGGEKETFTFDDCRGALLFMDGFDEFIDEAKKADITNIVSFMKKIDDIAFKYDIHIVVLSRTIAIDDYLNERTIKEKSFKLMPITEDQQNKWLKEHTEYDDYKETFKSIRDNKEMSDLLGIPLLFRVIVNSRFDKVSTNVIELYDSLTDHLLEKRNICEINDKEQVVSGLRELAYDIYCNDTDTVTVPEAKWDTRWIFAFYIRQVRKRVIGFFHRSFYQYFLARRIYSGILSIVTADQAEKLIGELAERELDDTVCRYLSLMYDVENKETINNNLKLVIDVLVDTEAYLNLKPRFPNGKAEKTRIGRTINVYRNTLHICEAFSYCIEKPFRDGIDVFLRIYPSNTITIYSDTCNKANLNGANLSSAKLRRSSFIGADLSDARLEKADLIAANLIRANLSGANLIAADLSEADLRRTDLSGACLREATIRRADMRGADLCLADLSGANLRRVDLSDADLSGANLVRTDLSGSNLRDANMIRANLSGTILSNANLGGANLSNANLGGANLGKVNLIVANLSGANLNRVDLSGSDLRCADLSGANLSEADLSEANLCDVNLSKATLDVKKLYNTILDIDKKELINPSIEGYETIAWINKHEVD